MTSRGWPGAAEHRGWLAEIVFTEAVNANEVRGALGGGRGPGHHDHQITGLLAPNRQHHLVDQSDHGIGGHRLDRKATARLRPISPWLLLLAVVVIVAVTGPLTVWLHGIAGNDPAHRIEAIKTGLTMTAGTGGFFALLLAFRQQRSTEIIAAVLAVGGWQYCGLCVIRVVVL